MRPLCVLSLLPPDPGCRCAWPASAHGITAKELEQLILLSAHMPHCLRLPCRYDLLHHTVDAQRRFPAAVFERPRYVPPPPPPAAEPKAAKGGAGDKAADKAAAGDKAAAAPAASASSGKKGGDKAAAPAAEAGGKADKKVGSGQGGQGQWATTVMLMGRRLSRAADVIRAALAAPD